MLRGLTIFTGLLGVVLLGVLVVIQVQRGLQEAPVAAASSDTDAEFADVELASDSIGGEAGSPPSGAEDIATLQDEPALTGGTGLDDISPATIASSPPPVTDDSPAASAPRTLNPDPTAFPSARPSTGPGEDVAQFPEPPSLEAPTATTTASEPPPTTVSEPPTRTILPAAGDSARAPIDEPARPEVVAPADTPSLPGSAAQPPAPDPAASPSPGSRRVLDLPPPPALDDQPATSELPSTSLPPAADAGPKAARATGPAALPETPTAITPGEARPAATSTTAPGESASAADPLVGVGDVSADAPRGPQSPRLQITKTYPAKATIGQPLVYSIHVSNPGSSTVRDVVLTDPIPAGSKLTGTVPQAELTAGMLTWKLGSMQPGDEHKIMVRVIPTRAGPLGSTATLQFSAQSAASTTVTDPATPIAGATGPGTLPEDNATPAGAVTVPPQPLRKTGVTLEVAAPKRVDLGDDVTLTFTLTNHTGKPQSGIVLRNMIPTQLEHPAGSDLEYPLPALPAGEAKTISLTLKAKALGQATNKATLTSGQKVLASDEDTINVGSVGTLSVEQRVPESAGIAANTTLTTLISNKADTASQPTTLAQTLAPGLDFVSASSDGTFDPVNGRITWQVPSLAPGTQLAFKAVVRPRQAGQKLTSLVRLTNGTRTIATSTESIQALGFAAPAVDIAGISNPAATGQPFDITFTLSNRGTAALSGTALKVNFPDTLHLLAIKGGKKGVADKTANLVIVPSQTTIAAGDSHKVILTVRAPQSGQHLLQTQFNCDQLRQPLVRTDAVNSLPSGGTGR
mgnify:CR=1 FL=1